MLDPSDQPDAADLRSLIFAAIDGTANSEQLRQLTERLRDDPSAQDEYLTLVDMHALLKTEDRRLSDGVLSGNASVSIQDPIPLQDAASILAKRVPSPKRVLKNRFWIVACFSALAGVILLFGWVLGPSGNQKPVAEATSPSVENTFATIVPLQGIAWKYSAPTTERIGCQKLHLVAGVLRIEFDSGVEVTLQGPAEYELLSPDKTVLTAGIFTADVPPGAEGFSVNTPSAEIVDLGTSFGIEMSDHGVAKVSVFEGEIEVAARDTAEKYLLQEGEAVRVGMDQQVEHVPFDVTSYKELWPISSGVVSASDTFQFLPPAPRLMRLMASDERIFVTAEGRNIQLTKDLDVNIVEPGEYRSVDDLTPAAIPAGRRVRSYTLNYVPETQLPPKRAQRVAGTITFEQPVLGMIVQHEELLASQGRFRRRLIGEAQRRRQLNLSNETNGDRIFLSEDRRTVRVELVAAKRSADLVRVIVADRPRRHRGRRRKQRHWRQNL